MNKEEAINLLNSGYVVIIPTETVYGIAARIDCPSAIETIYRLKNRPRNKPLLVHVASLDQVTPLITHLPPGASELIEKHWPGPLTLVLPTNEGTLAFRMPDNKKTLAIIKETGPLFATSANISGEEPLEDPSTNFSIPILLSHEPMSGKPSTIKKYENGEWITLRS